MKKAYIVPCTSKKIWDKPGDHPECVPAKDAYKYYRFPRWTGHAEKSGADWFILSSEYGLIPPDTLIKNYTRGIRNACADQVFRDKLRWQSNTLEFSCFDRVILVCCDQDQSKATFEELVQGTIGDGKAQYEFENVC